MNAKEFETFFEQAANQSAPSNERSAAASKINKLLVPMVTRKYRSYEQFYYATQGERSTNDVVQDIWVIALTKSSDPKPKVMTIACALTCVRNRQLNKIRKVKRNGKTVEIQEGDLVEDGQLDLLEGRFKEMLGRLKNMMGRLKEIDREILHLYYFEALTYEKITVKIGIAKEAARKRKCRALKKLEAMLNEND